MAAARQRRPALLTTEARVPRFIATSAAQCLLEPRPAAPAECCQGVACHQAFVSSAASARRGFAGQHQTLNGDTGRGMRDIELLPRHQGAAMRYTGREGRACTAVSAWATATVTTSTSRSQAAMPSCGCVQAAPAGRGRVQRPLGVSIDNPPGMTSGWHSSAWAGSGAAAPGHPRK